MTDLQMRLERHQRMSRWLSARSDSQLAETLVATEARPGWGSWWPNRYDGHDVFVKALPLTEAELAAPGSTYNHYELPTFYNYGVGSAGFGAFRELLAVQRVTGWVLAGESESFPLLFHHRVLPIARQGRRLEGEALNGYVTHWDGSVAVRRLVEARNASTHALVMFMEYVPNEAHGWLPQHGEAVEALMEDARGLFTFLRSKGMVHFDAHLHNMMTDGRRLYLADFGLAVDPSFELSDEEREFLGRHRHYDAAEFLGGFGELLRPLVQRWDEPTMAAVADQFGSADLVAAVRHLEALIADGRLELDPRLAHAIVAHRSVIVPMLRFFEDTMLGSKAVPRYVDDFFGPLLRDYRF